MTDPRHPDWSEELLRSDRVDDRLEERYRIAVRGLLERRLSPARRWLGGGMAILYLAFAIGLAFTARYRFPADPPTLRNFLWLMSAGAGVLAIGALWVCIQGRYLRRVHGSVLLLAALFMCGGSGIILLNGAWISDDPITRGQLHLAGTTLLVIAAGALLLKVIEDLHDRTQERLLRLECRLAELAEKLDRPKG